MSIEMPENYDDLGWRRINTDDPGTFPTIGRCEGNENEGFTFYDGDDEKSLASYGLFVNGWMPLPKNLEDNADGWHLKDKEVQND